MAMTTRSCSPRRSRLTGTSAHAGYPAFLARTECFLTRGHSPSITSRAIRARSSRLAGPRRSQGEARGEVVLRFEVARFCRIECVFTNAFLCAGLVDQSLPNSVAENLTPHDPRPQVP